MPHYNYEVLSHQDFEEVSRDLLQAEWNVLLEAFKEGRDSGIDLRHAATPGNTVIVQCKHYAKSGFTALLRHLKVSELPKIVKLKPNRYVVVTTVELSPKNKQDIIEALAPYIKSSSDVLGANELDGLLSKHPNVERANFKLWLTSTSVIDRILHNAEIFQTDFEVERIIQKLPRLVQNQSYLEAKEILKSSKVLVISGPPGIGKSTLAEMLLYSSLEDGYEPVVIQTDISEGKKLIRRGAKQIFYYDDFLGQTFLGDRREYFGQNQDKAVVDFMEMIKISQKSMFILTTREHILNNATSLSERLENSTLIRDRFVLKLEDYSFGDRAKILYNHLHFSQLSKAYKIEMLRDDFYLKVIDHSHYNPRLIEWLTDLSRFREVPPNNYQKYVTDLLDNPERIWDHAYRTQISEAGRCILLALYTDEGYSLQALASNFIELRHTRAKRYNQQIDPNEFRSNLSILEGGFLTIGKRSVQYLNPSIKGYVASLILNDPETSSDIFESAIRFQQIATLWRLKNDIDSQPMRLFSQYSIADIISKLTKLAETPSYDYDYFEEGNITAHKIDYGTEQRLRFFAELSNTPSVYPFLNQIYDSMEQLIFKMKPEMVSLWEALLLLREIEGFKNFTNGRGVIIKMRVLDKVLDSLPYARSYNWSELIDLPETTPGWQQRHSQKFYDGLNWYMHSGWQYDLDNCEDLYDKNFLYKNLSDLAQRKKRSRFFVTPLRIVRDDIESTADEAKNPVIGSGSPKQALPRRSTSRTEIQSMFNSLLLED